jgi:UDP-N-acetylmuramyl tripeptide synthase
VRVALLLAFLLLPGCNGRWVYQEAVGCPGGRVDQTKRITDTAVAGRLRHTVITTSSCLD